jgi:hypothetical protein
LVSDITLDVMATAQTPTVSDMEASNTLATGAVSIKFAETIAAFVGSKVNFQTDLLVLHA